MAYLTAPDGTQVPLPPNPTPLDFAKAIQGHQQRASAPGPGNQMGQPIGLDLPLAQGGLKLATNIGNLFGAGKTQTGQQLQAAADVRPDNDTLTNQIKRGVGEWGLMFTPMGDLGMTAKGLDELAELRTAQQATNAARKGFGFWEEPTASTAARDAASRAAQRKAQRDMLPAIKLGSIGGRTLPGATFGAAEDPDHPIRGAVVGGATAGFGPAVLNKVGGTAAKNVARGVGGATLGALAVDAARRFGVHPDLFYGALYGGAGVGLYHSARKLAEMMMHGAGRFPGSTFPGVVGGGAGAATSIADPLIDNLTGSNQPPEAPPDVQKTYPPEAK